MGNIIQIFMVLLGISPIEVEKNNKIKNKKKKEQRFICVIFTYICEEQYFNLPCMYGNLPSSLYFFESQAAITSALIATFN